MNGHWTQVDPANNPFQTHGWNGYNYAGDDTANLSHPNGMLFGWSCDWCGRAASAVSNTVTQS